jgi:hypothetical protein
MSDGLPWFRAYAKMVDDEKLRLLAFEDRWHFVAILCCKCAGLLDKGDALPLLRRKMGVKLGLAARDLDAMADRLAELNLIDPETFQPIGWGDRQYQSDSSYERVKRHRAKREAQGLPAQPTIPKAMREAIYARDGHVCTYCGSGFDLTLDHAVPESRGGGHDESNLVTACRQCNASKRDLTRDEFLARNGDETLLKQSLSVCGSTAPGEVALALKAIAAKTSFSDWWAVYPHKTGRKPCEAKWKASGLDAIADTLIADTVKRAAQDSGWLGGYVPNPLTYLNQERWNDDLRAAPVARAAVSEPSKTLGAMLKIRGMSNGMADHRTATRANEIALLGSGSDPGE